MPWSQERSKSSVRNVSTLRTIYQMYKVDWGNPPEEPSPEVLEAMRVKANELAKRIMEQILRY